MDNEKIPYSSDTDEQGFGTGLSVRRANIFFLWYTVLMLALTFFRIPGVPMTLGPLLYYIPLVVIALLLCRKDGTTLKTAFAFRGVKPLSIFLTVVICIGMHSFSHLISSLTNLLFPSFFETASKQMLGGGFLVNFIGVGLIPAFFEEFVVRGGMLNSYLRTGRVRAAVLLTAFLFGLLHMNPTQFFYAFAMGIVLALMFVLTGSIWPGILFHFLNNVMAPIATLLSDRYGEEFVSRYIFPFSRGVSDPKSALITTVAAAVGLIITILCLCGIARCEDNSERLRLFIRGGGGKGKLVTLPLIISIIVMVLMTAAVTYSLIFRMTTGA